jgi:hypothetical protein
MEFIKHNLDLEIEEIEKLIKEDRPDENIIDNEIIVKDILFPSEKDALNYLEDVTKIYNSISTKYLEAIENFSDTDISKSLTEKVDMNINNLITFPETLVDRFAKQKSSTKGCTNCKSTINKDFYKDKIEKKLEGVEQEEGFEELDNNKKLEIKLSTLACPICDSDDFLITDTDKDKISKLDNAIQNSIKKYDEEAMSFQIKTGQKTVCITTFQIEE